MGERVPAWVFVVLIVASWAAGRLLGRIDDRRHWMTPSLRRALTYHGNSIAVSVGLLDTDVARLAVALERYGHLPASDE